MSEIKLYKSPLKPLKLFLLSSIFVLPSAWLIFAKGDNHYWFPLCFFGLGYLLSLFHLLDRRVQIIINKNGIWYRTIRLNKIEWESIKEVYEIDVFKQKFISVVGNEKLKSKKKIYGWASYLNRKVGAQDINFNISQIKVNAKKIADLINILKDETTEKRNEVIKIYKDGL